MIATVLIAVVLAASSWTAAHSAGRAKDAQKSAEFRKIRASSAKCGKLADQQKLKFGARRSFVKDCLVREAKS